LNVFFVLKRIVAGGMGGVVRVFCEESEGNRNFSVWHEVCGNQKRKNKPPKQGGMTMNLTIFNPFRELAAVDRLFDNYFNSAITNAVSFITPRVDVLEEDGKLVVEAEMPGVKKGDVEVSVERGILTISAEKKNSREVKNKDYYLGERSWGKYQRSFRLSEDMDPNSVEASFEDGVLRVEIRRKPESAAKRIEIK